LRFSRRKAEMKDRLKRNMNASAGFRHHFLALIILSAVIVIGVIGYMLIEDMTFTEAVYMTVITITTVGFREVERLGPGGQYFTVFIVITGLGAVLFFLTGLFEFVLGEYLGDFWGRKKMENRISNLESHYVVCGYGRVGRSVADELAGQGKKFVVVEADEDVFKECLEEGHLCIHGSATEDHVLEHARLEHAVGLVSALGSDADNLYVILTARVLNPNALLVSRSEHPESEKKLEMVGADRVISPHTIAGRRMANLMLKPRLCEFLDIGITGNVPEYQLAEIMVSGGSVFDGMSIRDSRLRERTGVTVLAVRSQGEEAFNPNPPPETELRSGDVVIVIGTTVQLAKFESQQARGGG